MRVTYLERQELNKLSKDLFGTTSFWNKLVKKGYKDKETKTTKFFSSVDELKAYFEHVRTATNKMLEEMKASVDKNDISK